MKGKIFNCFGLYSLFLKILQISLKSPTNFRNWSVNKFRRNNMCKNGNHSNKLENKQLATKQFEMQSEKPL